MTAAGAATAPASEANDEAHAWVAAFAEGWRAPRGPDAFSAHFRDRLAPDVRLIQPGMPTLVGRAACEDGFVKPLFKLMPDLHGQVDGWAAHGETLYIELTLHGTIAGRQLSWRVCDRVTLRDGVALERHSFFDTAPILAAVATHPSIWPRILRLRFSGLTATVTQRRTR